MKPPHVAWLCVFAVAAFSAVPPSAASAGETPVEFGRCEKEPNKGPRFHYTDKACTQEAIIGERSRYEWSPGEGPRSHFTVKGKSLTLSSGSVQVACKAGGGNGTLLGPARAGVATLEWDPRDCKAVRPESDAGQACTSQNAAAGEIRSVPLEVTLVGHGEKGAGGKSEPSEGQAWVEIGNGQGELVLEFECAGVDYTLSGIASGVNGPGNKPATTFTEAFSEAEGGEQDLTLSYYSPALKGSVEEAAYVKTGMLLRFDEKYEIRMAG